MHLKKELFDRKKLTHQPTREGFGQGLLVAAQKDERIVGLCADLTDSTKMGYFAKAFPQRFIQVGVAEQNLVTVASGMAHEGKIPFAASYAAFSPGRNWEQIRTTIAYNNQPVKIVGSHTGLTVGPDGATHQALEDIALMRVMPNMRVIVPADAVEAKKATEAIAQDHFPYYIRLSRENSPVFTTEKTPFSIGKAHVFHRGSDVTLVSTGALTYEALLAAILLRDDFSVEVIHVHTIKPLDTQTILRSARKTRLVISLEEHQTIGGLGGAIAETLTQHFPVRLERIGIDDVFGESGTASELWNHYGLTAEKIVSRIKKVVKKR